MSILGAYAVYLHFMDTLERLGTYAEKWGIVSGNGYKLNKIKQILLIFVKEIETFNNKSELSKKCKQLISNLDQIFDDGPDNRGIIFVERKYVARVLNKIINQLSNFLC